jgi:peptide/nickel transport system substrate-binding protein
VLSSDVKDGRRVIIPGIASEWEISSDGLTWTLTIRKGVKFHDGTEVTAEDVVWSLQHVMGPQAKDYATSGSDSTSMSRIMDRIERTGPDQVGVTTKIPAFDFPLNAYEAGPGWAGVVLPKRATLHDLQEEEAYERNPISAGMMRLVKHVTADSMTFERFEDYYHQPENGFPTDKRVKFTVLDLRLVPEEATRVAALRAGDADIGPVSLASRQQVEAGGGRLVFGQEGAYQYVRLMGCWKPQFPCSDRRVRQALAYAMDPELMQSQLYGGPEVFQVKGWAGVTPSTIGYSPDLDPFPYDPDKARQLLAEAGYPGGKGFGKLVINTWDSVASPLMPEAAQLTAEFWKRELGLDVEVKVGEQAALKKAQSLTEDLYGQILWRDNETRIEAAGSLRNSFGQPENISRAHDDPELFALVDQALAVVDPVEREKVLNSTYRRLRDEAYFITPGYMNIPWGVGPRIRTWEPYPLALYVSAVNTITLE